MNDLLAATIAAVPKDAMTNEQWLRFYRDEIGAQLGRDSDVDAFIQPAIQCLRSDPRLERATHESVVGSVMFAAQLRLDIGPARGYFHLTPQREEAGGEVAYVCVPVIGYQGYAELAYRSERVVKVGAFHVRKGDDFNRGASSERGEFFDYKPLDNDPTRPAEAVVAYAKIRDTSDTFWHYMTMAEIDDRRPLRWKESPWGDPRHRPQMERKTVFRAMTAWLPKSPELGRALQSDERRVERRDGVPELVTADTGTTLDDEPQPSEESA